MSKKELESLLKSLPEDLEREVIDFIEFLLMKYQLKQSDRKNFVFDWEGGLAELNENFRSIDLQHKTLEWR